jgi:hypothetical protein
MPSTCPVIYCQNEKQERPIEKLRERGHSVGIAPRSGRKMAKGVPLPESETEAGNELTGWIQCQQKGGGKMQIPREAVLLRIFFGENDKFHRVPLLEAFVLKAREMHLGGATVLRGHIGFGHSSRIHTSKILRLSQDLPVVVEIIDSQEKIDAFLPVLDGMMSSGLITMERAEVLQYGTEKSGRSKAPDPSLQRRKI